MEKHKNPRLQSMKANKDVLYLMAFSETAIYSRDKIKEILPTISEMMDKGFIKSSAMLIYRLQENSTDSKPDMSLQYDIYDKTEDTAPLSQEHIVYRGSARGLYIRNYLARLMDEYIAVSHGIYESPRGNWKDISTYTTSTSRVPIPPLPSRSHPYTPQYTAHIIMTLCSLTSTT